jgi:activator of HSP90 ATPase
VEALYTLAKSRLPTALEAKFAEFPAVLIETHGKDLTVSAGPSRSETPAPGASTPTIPASASSAPASVQAPVQPVKEITEKLEALNTATISVDATFMASADDLFRLLTDENRIPSWSRAPAKVRFEHYACTEKFLYRLDLVDSRARFGVFSVQWGCQW